MPNDRNRNNDNNTRTHESRSEQESLKRREYRGSDGQIHHHTRTYMEQHGRDKSDNDRHR